MLKILFTKEDIDKLNYERLNHPHPRVQQKMEVLYLKSMRLPHKEIARICKVTETTARSYMFAYVQHGIEALKKFCIRPRRAKLGQCKLSIEEGFLRHSRFSCRKMAITCPGQPQTGSR